MKLEQNLSKPLLSFYSLCAAAADPLAAPVDEAKSRYERLRNQPSDEERREQLVRELRLEIQAKVKQDLRYAVRRTAFIDGCKSILIPPSTCRPLSELVLAAVQG